MSNNIMNMQVLRATSALFVHDQKQEANIGEREISQQDYELLLEKYEEVEDLTCAICFDKM